MHEGIGDRALLYHSRAVLVHSWNEAFLSPRETEYAKRGSPWFSMELGLDGAQNFSCTIKYTP